jgi:hypothetical protein
VDWLVAGALAMAEALTGTPPTIARKPRIAAILFMVNLRQRPGIRGPFNCIDRTGLVRDTLN